MISGARSVPGLRSSVALPALLLESEVILLDCTEQTYNDSELCFTSLAIKINTAELQVFDALQKGVADIANWHLDIRNFSP